LSYAPPRRRNDRAQSGGTAAMRKREREAWKILKPLRISTQRNRRGGHYRGVVGDFCETSCVIGVSLILKVAC
jgi:hypothetical protein